MKTTALFFPFDLFGSGGTRAGVELLADAFEEMIADNKRERVATRARAYTQRIRWQEFALDKLADYTTWRQDAAQAVRPVFADGDFLLWVAGNHLGVLPVYDELPADSLVVQFDAHLDIHNLSECTTELSHGNFLLHVNRPLRLINLGHRDLLLKPGYIAEHYQAVYSALDLSTRPNEVLEQVKAACKDAAHVFFDIDCDVLDVAYFPGVAHSQPFGISTPVLLHCLDALWSEKVTGLALSEFEPGRDVRDQSLATLVWLMEWLLLKVHEK